MNLYFECNNGISGDMSVAALLDLGADREKLKRALDSMGLENEFSYKISEVMINAVKATDFDVILPHNHKHHDHSLECRHQQHRNLDDVNKIIDSADIAQNAKSLAKDIFKIVAQAEAKVHNKNIENIHFHEVGATDSIVDIVSFALLFDDLNPDNVYFSALSEGQGSVECQHGILNVPVPAVCEIAAKYQIPLKITDTKGEMVTPTGIAIVAALYKNKKLDSEFVIEKIGYGAGKRKYKNPILRVMQIK